MMFSWEWHSCINFEALIYVFFHLRIGMVWYRLILFYFLLFSVFVEVSDKGRQEVKCLHCCNRVAILMYNTNVTCDILVSSEGHDQPTGHGVKTMTEDPLCIHGCKEYSANKDTRTLILLNTTVTDRFRCIYDDGLCTWEKEIVVVKAIELESSDSGNVTWMCPPHMKHNVSTDSEFFYVGCSPHSVCLSHYFFSRFIIIIIDK